MNDNRVASVVLIILAVLLVAVVAQWQRGGGPAEPVAPDIAWPEEESVNRPAAPASDPGPGKYLFCFWNVENLFDDVEDGRTGQGDPEYDRYFATDKAALEQKLRNLSSVLIRMNNGKGPDIVALAEIESRRAVELLQEALNRRLEDQRLHYTELLFKAPTGGRHIAPAILTRLPVERDRTQILGNRQRILEGRVKVAGRPLVVIASHWSSRISDKTGATRAKYGDVIYGRFRQIATANPQVDLLVCGDFNDNPDDTSVLAHLHATGDEAAVGQSRPPLLYNPFARLYEKGGATLIFNGRKYIFDQICLSPGLLDEQGWGYVSGSARITEELADSRWRPLRFGGANDRRPLEARGASDHFPVSVELRVR